MLTGVGVDFIVADSTNIQSTGAAADALQLRPWEVMGEEWLALRRLGIRTPKIAIWQNLQDPNGNLWESYVNGAYSDPQYDDIIFKDKKSGKKARSAPLFCLDGLIATVNIYTHSRFFVWLAQVMFTTANPTQALVEKIESTGDIVVVVMWAERCELVVCVAVRCDLDTVCCDSESSLPVINSTRCLLVIQITSTKASGHLCLHAPQSPCITTSPRQYSLHQTSRVAST